MNDFQDFKKTISDTVLEKWYQEIHNSLVAELDKQFKDDPDAWNRTYTQTYAFRTSMRLLEACHNWLAE